MRVDYHMHTPLCNHAEGEPREFVERAIEIGLDEIGFSEHSPWMIQHPNEKLAPTGEEFAQYVETVQSLQREYARGGERSLSIRLGIEMDFIPSRLDQAREWQEKYPWDYVIGSVHHLGGWGFDNPAYKAEFGRRNIGEVYGAYFGAVVEMANTGLFDCVGHLDLIKKFGHRPDEDLTPMYRNLAAELRKADVVVELNTSGLDKDAKEFYPARGMLDALAEAGVPLTMGSDAHRPEEVGRYFDRARDLLQSLGVEEIVAWECRKRRMVPL